MKLIQLFHTVGIETKLRQLTHVDLALRELSIVVIIGQLYHVDGNSPYLFDEKNDEINSKVNEKFEIFSVTHILREFNFEVRN